MSGPRNHPSFPSETGLEPYHDDPTMGSATQLVGNPRSPALHSAGDARDSDTTATSRPPYVSIRSAVPLLPTPGTVSNRHPTYVNDVVAFVFCGWNVDSLFLLRRNRSCCAFGSWPWVACFSAL